MHDSRACLKKYGQFNSSLILKISFFNYLGVIIYKICLMKVLTKTITNNYLGRSMGEDLTRTGGYVSRFMPGVGSMGVEMEVIHTCTAQIKIGHANFLII